MLQNHIFNEMQPFLNICRPGQFVMWTYHMWILGNFGDDLSTGHVVSRYLVQVGRSLSLYCPSLSHGVFLDRAMELRKQYDRCNLKKHTKSWKIDIQEVPNHKTFSEGNRYRHVAEKCWFKLCSKYVWTIAWKYVCKEGKALHKLKIKFVLTIIKS